jgi:hypothetical protein
MAIKPLSHSYATLGAIATFALIIACVAHEVVGHGSMCIIVGGHITLLTSVYSHCSNGGWLTSAAGPLMSLAVGGLFWAILWSALPALSIHWRLFMVFAMAFNLFWGAGYFVKSAVTNDGDWAFVLRDLALQPNWLWRCLMGALGVYLYYRSIQLIAFYLPSGTPLVVPYLVAGAVACLPRSSSTGQHSCPSRGRARRLRCCWSVTARILELKASRTTVFDCVRQSQ